MALAPSAIWERELQAWCNGSVPASGLRRIRSATAQLAARLCLRSSDASLRAAEATHLRRIAVDRIRQCLAAGEQGNLLDLSGLQLTTLPPGLHRLAHLKAINASGNRDLRELPDDLARCTELRQVMAKKCSLVEVPAWIGDLKQIRSLDFSGNRGLRTLPEEIGQCRMLKSLNIDRCNLSELPRSLGSLGELRSLRVTDNLALSELPESLNLDRVAVAASGTNLALLSRLFKEPNFDAETKADLTRRIETVKAHWTECRRLLAQGGPDAQAAIEQLQRMRMGPSTSVKEEWRAETAWLKAAQTVKEWSVKHLPLTVQRMVEINRLVWPQQPSNELPASSITSSVAMPDTDVDNPRLGVLRTLEIDTESGLSYAPGSTVKRQLAELVNWYERTALMMGPDDVFDQIRLAAMLGQRLVSIHPFNDGNGRTTRLVMDWMLQRHGLPPAPPAGEATMEPAIFASVLENRRSPEDLIKEAVTGMERVVLNMRRTLEGHRLPA